jgi:hypothetical protein
MSDYEHCNRNMSTEEELYCVLCLRKNFRDLVAFLRFEDFEDFFGFVFRGVCHWGGGLDEAGPRNVVAWPCHVFLESCTATAIRQGRRIVSLDSRGFQKETQE